MKESVLIVAILFCGCLRAMTDDEAAQSVFKHLRHVEEDRVLKNLLAAMEVRIKNEISDEFPSGNVQVFLEPQVTTVSKYGEKDSTPSVAYTEIRISFTIILADYVEETKVIQGIITNVMARHELPIDFFWKPIRTRQTIILQGSILNMGGELTDTLTKPGTLRE